jgi:Homeodomain-like domain
VTNRRTLTMDVQELVRLVRDGVSDREIAALVGLNRRTVSRYHRWASEQHLLDGPFPNLGELHEQLQATLPMHLPPQQTSSVAAYQDQILAYRQQGLELAAIRARLEEQHGVPISYDAIWRLVHRLEQSQLPETFVRVEVPPGSEAQVDFGYAGLQIDPASGRLRKSWGSCWCWRSRATRTLRSSSINASRPGCSSTAMPSRRWTGCPSEWSWTI